MTPDGYAGDILRQHFRHCNDPRVPARRIGCDTRAWHRQKFASQLSATISRLQPYKIGHNGNLQEWYHDWPDQDPRHRHQSHLFGLYPGHHLSVDDTPQLAAAAARTLEIKGDETTGWSTGWRVNLYARLRDGKTPITFTANYLTTYRPTTIAARTRAVEAAPTPICSTLTLRFKSTATSEAAPA